MTHSLAAPVGRPVWSWGAAALVCLLAATGCGRGKPAMTPKVVALEMPPPPARVISTPPEPVAPTEATTVERPAPANRPARTTRSSQPRPEAARPAEAPRTETAEATSQPTTAPAEPASPAPLLRTPQTADETDADRRTQEVLGRATNLLDRVNQARLGQQARAQHETARRFVQQAQQALSDRNFLLAASLADKAETLARGLSR